MQIVKTNVSLHSLERGGILYLTKLLFKKLICNKKNLKMRAIKKQCISCKKFFERYKMMTQFNCQGHKVIC